MYHQHYDLLQEIGRKYGVQPRFIVALWGIETSYGANTGGYPVVDALATLAYDGRRSDFFRSELMNALKIIDGGHIAAQDMKGSWAGAMGQNQFMPSSFFAYATDYNGDGRKDIWNTLEDVFASTANYLSKLGWEDDVTWGRRVSLPKGFDTSLASRKITRPISEWQRLGVRRFYGQDLPHAELQASIILPDEKPEHAYMVYENYKRIMKWNRSLYFATTVGILADKIEGW